MSFLILQHFKHEIHFQVSAIFNPNPQIHVHPCGRSADALQKISVAPHSYPWVPAQNNHGIPRKKISFRVMYRTSQRQYIILPSFFSPKLTQYVSPEGSNVEQVLTCILNLELSSSCFKSRITMSCTTSSYIIIVTRLTFMQVTLMRSLSAPMETLVMVNRPGPKKMAINRMNDKL